MYLKRFFKKLLKSYAQAKNTAFSPKYLLYTNMMISVTISSVGDTLEQNYELHTGQLKKYDLVRTVQMGFSGSVAGFICHFWYQFLDRIIVGKSLYMAMKKLVLDQFICSPIVITSFFLTVALFEEDPLSNFNSEVKEKFWILYKAEWTVWPPAQLINFYFLPTRYRVLYDNTISLGYDVYTSNVKHRKSEKYLALEDND